MIELDLGLQAILDGPDAMVTWLEAQGVDWRRALGSYGQFVKRNTCAQRALIRTCVKQLQGDAMQGCEYDGDSTHLAHVGCRLDISVRRGPSPSPPSLMTATDLSSSVVNEEVEA